ncbi:hypothetical protein CP533_4793 [Ophiocordyceps camponoti-saundersi (nom. inval.)]|nr:hypothetical protein CP533_4793 [Ophiocordyceps camponoti-saundersi (nom. inval.)]
MSRSSVDLSHFFSGHSRQGENATKTDSPPPRRNRHSIRSNKGNKSGFSFSSLRGNSHQEPSRRIFRLIKAENSLVSTHLTAGRERIAIAQQLSEWGEGTGDEAVSDLTDKVGVILSEIGEQEDAYAHAIDESPSRLKAIRNTEKSVQPSRENRARMAEELSRLKAREPDSSKVVVMEQELVRAEAENMVAEAQLTNVTRQRIKETYDAEFCAIIERAEKQIILAKHGRRILSLLDDTPVVPGDNHQPYTSGPQARQVLDDCAEDMREWQPDHDTYLDTVSNKPPGDEAEEAAAAAMESAEEGHH